MKRLVLALIISVSLFACDSTPTTDQVESDRQENLQKEGQAQAGLPGIHNFQEKKLLKTIYELRDDEKIINYAYLFNEFNGKLIFIGKCMGYGIPYSTQYSNPEKIEWIPNHGYLTLPQAEPNGLFMPSSSDGTWVMLLDKNGTPHASYFEPKVIVSPVELTADGPSTGLVKTTSTAATYGDHSPFNPIPKPSK